MRAEILLVPEDGERLRPRVDLRQRDREGRVRGRQGGRTGPPRHAREGLVMAPVQEFRRRSQAVDEGPRALAPRSVMPTDC